MPQRSLVGPRALLFSALVLLAAPAALAQPGALDPTLGDGNGYVLTGSDIAGTASAEILLQPDGLIVVVGYNYVRSVVFLVRYFPDGALDPAFGDGGSVSLDLGYAHESIEAAALQPDGRIVVAGGVGSTSCGCDHSFLARFLPDGTLDLTFGDRGIVFHGSGIGDLALQPDGKILAVRNVYVLRHLPDGTLDPTFGAGGVADTPIVGVTSLVLQPDGKIVVAGEVLLLGYRPAVGRLNADGSVDETFGDGGVRRLPFPDYSYAEFLEQLPDGRMVALMKYGGTMKYDSGGAIYGLCRLLPDGDLDPSFGAGGKVEVDVGLLIYPYNFTLYPDGKVVVVGFINTQDGVNHFVGRHLADGAFDPAFGNGGYATYNIGVGVTDLALTTAIQPDGRILTGGYSGVNFVLARFLGDAAVAVSAAPTAPPVMIPPSGDAFAFTVTLANATDQPQTFQVWTEADGPLARSPALGPVAVTLDPGETLTRTVTQRVPGAAPAGDYVYAVHAGAFPGGAVTSASFPLTKAAGALAARMGADDAWVTTGWNDVPASAAVSEASAALSLSGPSPHPFREGTRLTLSVPSAQALRVAVYDALGREVAVLHDGEMAAGTHALALDGAGLAAGVYVVRAEGAGSVAVRRVVRY